MKKDKRTIDSNTNAKKEFENNQVRLFLYLGFLDVVIWVITMIGFVIQNGDLEVPEFFKGFTPVLVTGGVLVATSFLLTLIMLSPYRPSKIEEDIAQVTESVVSQQVTDKSETSIGEIPENDEDEDDVLSILFERDINAPYPIDPSEYIEPSDYNEDTTFEEDEYGNEVEMNEVPEEFTLCEEVEE